MWGNMYITDETNDILIYGTYSEDGEVRQDVLEIQPKVGDKVVLYGVLGTYNSEPQMKNGWLVDFEINNQNPEGPSIDVEPGSKITIAKALVINNVVVSYSSDNTHVLYFEEVEGKTIMKTKGTGTATVTTLYGLDYTTDLTTKVYTVTCLYNVYTTQYSSTPQLMDENGNYFAFYCSGAGQYQWLADVMKNEDETYKTGTFEIAVCNWNSKKYYRGCVLSVTLEDGTKVYNNLNFQ